MKVLARSLLILLLLTGAASAAKEAIIIIDKSVNDLIKEGYKIVSTNSFGYSTPTGDGFGKERTGVLYHLQKNNDFITCIFADGETGCVKP